VICATPLNNSLRLALLFNSLSFLFALYLNSYGLTVIIWLTNIKWGMAVVYDSQSFSTLSFTNNRTVPTWLGLWFYIVYSVVTRILTSSQWATVYVIVPSNHCLVNSWSFWSYPIYVWTRSHFTGKQQLNLQRPKISIKIGIITPSLE